jgi:hypothetical protein
MSSAASSGSGGGSDKSDGYPVVAIPQFSLAVVGAPYPNKDGSNRQFEVMLCTAGEAVELLPEPQNKFDEHAVAVISTRGVQLGYLESERAPYVQGLIRNAHELRAIFQCPTRWGCIIRVGVDVEPTLPDFVPNSTSSTRDSEGDPDYGFEPDFIPPDE